MPKYKILKSVAHNTGHHMVSAMSWYEGKYGVEHARDAARANGVGHIVVNLLSGDVTPAVLDDHLLKFGSRATHVLARLLRVEGWTPEALQSARLDIDFDQLSCRVELVDDRGIAHAGNIEQWGVSPRGGHLPP